MADVPPIAKHALVTGASGGIGEEFCGLLAAEGFDLVIVARSEDQLNRVAGVLNTKHQARIIPVALDLTVREACEALAAELADRDIVPDVVINNAGFGLHGHTAEIPVHEQVAMVDLNIRAATDLSLRYLPSMLQRKRGGIMNVSSIAAYMPAPYMPVYHATKSYLLSFTLGLASEYRGSGVTISALCPGYVPTGFQARANMEGLRMVKTAPRLSADEVARLGWEGFKRGERIIIPGLINRVMAYVSHILPYQLPTGALRVLSKPLEQAKTDDKTA